MAPFWTEAKCPLEYEHQNITTSQHDTDRVAPALYRYKASHGCRRSRWEIAPLELHPVNNTVVTI